MLEQMCTGGGTITVWLLFIAFILFMLILDLKVFHRKSHEPSMREALLWTGFWILLALAFNALIWYECGPQHGLEFFTGYILEKSLSVDNLFVILLVFASFNIPRMFQHRILFWGIVGALILRGAFIITGAALVSRFEWLFYVFGVILIWSGTKMFKEDEEEFDHDKNIAVRVVRKLFPVAKSKQNRFFTKENGKRAVTVLFVALFVVEFTDLVFAFDSIPAIFAITTNPFIVFTSNVFAILGLRSLYFVVAKAHDAFHHLKTGLALILIFIGVKLLIKHWYEVPTIQSLMVVMTILVVGIFYSIAEGRQDAQEKNKEKSSRKSKPADNRRLVPRK